jgi:hypothetical protein
MARSRNIKPGFFTNDVLGELPALTRLLFAGLWTISDRDGRIEDRPKKIRAEVLPYDQCDPEEMLQALHDSGFILRYEVAGKKLIQILAWAEHQNPHIKEAASTLPAPCKSGASPVQTTDEESPLPEPAGLIPSSLIPDSLSSDPFHSEAKASGGEPPTDRDMVFAVGVPMLTEGGTVTDKNARSLLARFCKEYGEQAVRKALEQTAHDRPGEPVSWLQSLLKARPKGAEPEWRREQRNRVAAFAPGVAARPTLDAGDHDVFALTSR